MTENRMLQEAIKAIENGQLAKARDLLTRLLRQDQTNVDTWLYMSAVVETVKERTFCLENVLKYDPSNKTAIQGLVMLGVMSPDDSTPAIRPVNERQIELPAILGASAVATASGKKRVSLSPVQIGVLGVFGLVAIALIVFGIFGNPFFTGTPVAYNTPAPFFTAGPTPTYLPTNTPQGGIIENVSGPTPLVYQLDATYTPTPRYVDTPHPAIGAYESGINALDDGDYEQAIEFLTQADKAAPGSIDILYYLGEAYLLNGNYDNARSYFDKALQIDTNYAPARLGRAQAFMGMSDDIDVSEDLYKAVSADPNYIDARLAWASYKIQHQQYEEALNDLDIAAEIDPENPQLFYLRAKVYIAENLPDQALEAAQVAFDRDKLNIHNYRLLAYALIIANRSDEAIPLLETYLSHEETDYFGWYLLGRAQLAVGEAQTALDIFRETYANDKTIYEMSYYWGLALINLEDYPTAVERLQVPIERLPRWFEPYAAQAQAYYLNEQYGRAKEILEAGAARAITDGQKALLYYWRGMIYTPLGYPEISETNWEKLLELPPDAVPAEYWSAAQQALGNSGAAPTPTRVPTTAP